MGYSSQLAKAQEYFELGDYTNAYSAVRGMEMKEKDQPAYDKYRVLALVSGEFEAYQSFMESSIYDMALDSLVRAVGRCQKYRADAETYECAAQLNALEEKAVGALSGFGISQERAVELFEIEDKTQYSIEIDNILVGAGLVTEN